MTPSIPDLSGREAGPHPDRRQLVRALSGGLVLATNRLPLPPGGDTADARGAYDGVLGGRHGRDRRGRNGRHRHDRDKRQDHDPPKGFFDNEGELNIQFIFVNNNDLGTAPISATCYSFKWKSDEVLREETKAAKPETGVRFDTAVKSAALYIDHDQAMVRATNPYLGYPTIAVALAAGGLSQDGPQDMAIGSTISLQRGRYKLVVTRLADEPTFKSFSVLYES
ncbi:MAG: hypothetical protein U0031_06740 [Thermomicrobiales bacterium]